MGKYFFRIFALYALSSIALPFILISNSLISPLKQLKYIFHMTHFSNIESYESPLICPLFSVFLSPSLFLLLYDNNRTA
jgi:hypothetical protein